MKLTLLKLVEIFWLAESVAGVDPFWFSEVSDRVPVLAVGDSVRVGGETDYASGVGVLRPSCLITPVEGGYSVLCEADGSGSPVFGELREAVAWAYAAGV